MSRLVVVHNLPASARISDDWKPRKRVGTIVLDRPLGSELLNAYANSILNVENPLIAINIGAAFVRWDDQLNKKVGRELAQSRMKPITFEVKLNRIDDKAAWYHLVGKDADLGVQYTVTAKVYRGDKNLRIMGVQTYENRA